jgi:hypothetical protein
MNDRPARIGPAPSLPVPIPGWKPFDRGALRDFVSDLFPGVWFCAEHCSRSAVMRNPISPSFDPTLSCFRSHLVPPTMHAEVTEVRRKDGENDFGGREGHGVSGRHRVL